MESALHEAVRRNDAAAVKALLEADRAAVNATDFLDLTPLHIAALGGRDALARLLLAAGADPDARDESGCTPLHRAALGAHADVIRSLLLYAADCNVKDEEGRTALSCMHQSGAAAERVAECVALMAEHQEPSPSELDAALHHDGDAGGASEAATVASASPSPPPSPLASPSHSAPHEWRSDDGGGEASDASPRSRQSYRSAPAGPSSSRQLFDTPPPSSPRSQPAASPVRGRGSGRDPRTGHSRDWDNELQDAHPPADDATALAWPCMVLSGESALPYLLQPPRAPLRAVCLRGGWTPPCIALLCKAPSDDGAPSAARPQSPPRAQHAQFPGGGRKKRGILRRLAGLLGHATQPPSAPPPQPPPSGASVRRAAPGARPVLRSAVGVPYLPRGWVDLSLDVLAFARDEDTLLLSLPGRTPMPPAPPARTARAAGEHASRSSEDEAEDWHDDASDDDDASVDYHAAGGASPSARPARRRLAQLAAARDAALASRLVIVISPCPAAELAQAFDAAMARCIPAAVDAWRAACQLAQAEADAVAAAVAAGQLTQDATGPARAYTAQVVSSELERAAAHDAADYRTAGDAKAHRDAAQEALEAMVEPLRRYVPEVAWACADAADCAAAAEAAAAAAEAAAADAAAVAGLRALTHAQREDYDAAQAAQETQAAQRILAADLRRLRSLVRTLAARAASAQTAVARSVHAWRADLARGNAGVAHALDALGSTGT